MMIAVVVSALWKGQWRERLIALVFAFPSVLYLWLPPGSLFHLARGPRALIDDLILFAACLICVRGARRYWVIWAAAIVLLEVIADVAMLLDPDVTYWAAASANVMWSWILGGLLIWASFTAPRAAAA